jgi:hypothetical protein
MSMEVSYFALNYLYKYLTANNVHKDPAKASCNIVPGLTTRGICMLLRGQMRW